MAAAIWLEHVWYQPQQLTVADTCGCCHMAVTCMVSATLGSSGGDVWLQPYGGNTYGISHTMLQWRLPMAAAIWREHVWYQPHQVTVAATYGCSHMAGTRMVSATPCHSGGDLWLQPHGWNTHGISHTRLQWRIPMAAATWREHVWHQPHLVTVAVTYGCSHMAGTRMVSATPVDCGGDLWLQPHGGNTYCISHTRLLWR
jgi:hypothetical protein